MVRLACDVHTHTIFSRHAYSTVEENVRAAAACNFELLGVTDHFSPMIHGVGPEGASMREFQEFINMRMWPREWHGVQLMHGCEADIVDLQGRLFGWDIPVTYHLSVPAEPPYTMLADVVFSNCQYVIASVHEHGWAEGATREQNTQMYVRALEHPKVLILGHTGRSGLDFDEEAVAEAARDAGKLIEINEASFFGRNNALERCEQIACACARVGCMVSTASDAHISYDVARLERVRALLERVDFPQHLVATRSAEAFLEVYENFS
ncbi:MAG: phosphatase [Atopobiaceae bacterium]|nr:phosphatase [Atopobiaceae bacterium]